MNQESSETLRIGSRASALARWQAEWVSAELQRIGVRTEIVLVTTSGDTDQRPLGSIGGQGLFTKEIQRALLDDRIDLAVHSLKDLPTEAVDGLTLGAVPKRASPHDALVSQAANSLADLPEAARIGTGSQRRRAQLRSKRPDLQVLDIRGNVDTRLRKLAEGEYDAIILAEAGLHRLGLEDNITAVLTPEEMMPAVGQGALGIECRADDATTLGHLASLNDRETEICVTAERLLLAALQAGCSAPVGANCRPAEGQFSLQAVALSVDGQTRLYSEAHGADPHELASRATEELLQQGAAKLIEG